MPFLPKQAHGLIMKLRTATGDDAVKAELTKGTSNSKIHFQAKAAGTGGNSITVTIVNPGSDGTLTIGVVGNAITITLGYASSAINSTVNDVIAAIYASAAAAALVDADNADGNGTGLLAAASVSSLTGGLAATHTFEVVNGIGDATIPGLGRTALEFTSHSSEDGFAEYMKSIIREGRELSLPLKFDPLDAVHVALKAEEASDDASVLQFEFAYEGSDFETDALILDIPLSNPVKGLIETTVRIQFTGAPRAI